MRKHPDIPTLAELEELKIGKLESGHKNLISDVPGVTVGHFTYKDGDIQTGITAILPHEGNLFKEKVVAATYVMNGFGKSIGLMQIDELGTLETPILLTNTLSVGRVATGLIQYMLEQNPDIGLTAGSVNPIVGECNDGYINAIRNMAIEESHVRIAIESANESFEQGAVGAGTGMVAFNLKGGIGSASRIVTLDQKRYTLGVLVLTNFGSLSKFTIDGLKTGEAIQEQSERAEQGSMIAVIATDIPLSDRQLKRVLKRIPAGMARTGAYFGTGSGDVFYGFSTAHRINHSSEQALSQMQIIHETRIDSVFQATIEATEAAILNSMRHAETTVGRDERVVKSLKTFL
ncbi:MAG: aminopeptidase [Clostridiales bacterium 38-18]|nr:MAG: aminopeptidase [Clostridiales bacterium 38-18]